MKRSVAIGLLLGHCLTACQPPKIGGQSPGGSASAASSGSACDAMAGTWTIRVSYPGGASVSQRVEIRPDGQVFSIRPSSINQALLPNGTFAGTCQNGLLHTTIPQVGDFAYSQEHHTLLIAGNSYVSDTGSPGSLCDAFLGAWNQDNFGSNTTYTVTHQGGDFAVTWSTDLPNRTSNPAGSWHAVCQGDRLHPTTPIASANPQGFFPGDLAWGGANPIINMAQLTARAPPAGEPDGD